MGGLIARRAIVRANDLGSATFVEDVVTMGTPHVGSPVTKLCSGTDAPLPSVLQCRQMDPQSDFITKLNDDSTKSAGFHETRGGTDWTLLGSYGDTMVPITSSTASQAVSRIHVKHRVRYQSELRHIGHSDYFNKSGSFELQHSHDYEGRDYAFKPSGASPNKMAYDAAFHHADW